jgi:hypothetical protein
VLELTTNEVAFTLPNFTEVAPEKFVPVITTDSPFPAVVGENDVIVGAGILCTSIVTFTFVLDSKSPSNARTDITTTFEAFVDGVHTRLSPVATTSPTLTAVPPLVSVPFVPIDFILNFKGKSSLSGSVKFCAAELSIAYVIVFEKVLFAEPRLETDVKVGGKETITLASAKFEDRPAASTT